MAAAVVEKILPNVTGEARHDEVTLDTWFDRLMKALTVWLPLLVSSTLFLNGFSGESMSVVCYPPSNFTIPQANYLNAFCKESLAIGPIRPSMFPSFVLSFGLLMYVPHLLWKILLDPELSSRISFITKEMEKPYGEIGDTRIAYSLNWSTLHSLAEKERSRIRDAHVSSFFLRKALMTTFSESKKIMKVQIGKIVLLVIFSTVSFFFLIQFDIMLQQDNVFSCRAKISTNNVNESNYDEYFEPVCKVIGLEYSFYVSVVLSILFFLAVLLSIIFVMYIKKTGYNFFDNVFEELNDLSKEYLQKDYDKNETEKETEKKDKEKKVQETKKDKETKKKDKEKKEQETKKKDKETKKRDKEKKVQETKKKDKEKKVQETKKKDKETKKKDKEKKVKEAKATAFSDYSILGRLCEENRHLMPNLNRIMNIKALQDTMKRGEEYFRPVQEYRETMDAINSYDPSGDNGVECLDPDGEPRVQPYYQWQLRGEPRKQPDVKDSSDDSSSTNQSKNRPEDETRVQSSAGEDTTAVHHRGSKNKSQIIEMESTT